MLYKVRLSALPHRAAWFRTWDEQVVSASPAFNWAVGKRLYTVLVWLEAKYIPWKVEQ